MRNTDLRILSRAPSDEQHLRFYHGRSMLGIFRPGDYLSIETAPIAAIRPGDVVVFHKGDQKGEPDDVVHRVVDIMPGGLVTQGDNNARVDARLVTQDNLLGQVTHLERSGRTRRVRAGRGGLRQARWQRVWRGARRRVQRRGWRIVTALGRRPYRWLREGGLVSQLWQPAITKIALTSKTGTLVKYVSGGRTVAQWRAETERFWCRRPYDLIISRPT